MKLKIAKLWGMDLDNYYLIGFVREAGKTFCIVLDGDNGSLLNVESDDIILEV